MPTFIGQQKAVISEVTVRIIYLQAVIETAPYYEVACPREEIERMQEIIQAEYPQS